MLHNTMICVLGALVALPALAQPPDNPARRESVACDRLAGAAREQCLRDERRRAERPGDRREPAGRCDALVGQEKEHCLREGGTVQAGAQSSRRE